jgi:hypothetical protein
MAERQGMVLKEAEDFTTSKSHTIYEPDMMVPLGLGDGPTRVRHVEGFHVSVLPDVRDQSRQIAVTTVNRRSNKGQVVMFTPEEALEIAQSLIQLADPAYREKVIRDARGSER